MHNHAAAAAKPTLNRAERRRQQKAARQIVRNQSAGNLDARTMLAAAEQLRKQGGLDEAEAACRKIIDRHPDLAEAHIAVGTLLTHKGDDEGAYPFFKKALELAPNNLSGWRRFGHSLFRLGHFDAALIALRKAANLEPPNEDTLLQIGRTLEALERSEEALAVFAAAAEHFPQSSSALLERGLQEQALGRFDEARATFEKVIELDPNRVEVHFRLATMGQTLDGKEESIERMLEIATDAKNPVERRAASYFAIARIHNKQKHYDEAFDSYREANDLLTDIVSFDPVGIGKYIDLCSKYFTPQAFEILKDAGSPSDVPVFIVGMPRSGTTLVEQIISSHPAVEAGGEERMMSHLGETLMRESKGRLKYPVHVAQLDTEGLRGVGDTYLNHMRARFSDGERITDKNPFNFFHVGLIRILFPHATIIHCHRDPMDTCLSCYFQFFGDAKALSFTTTQENLVAFYNHYRRMMDHWHAVMPGRILDVCYEEMITDQEGLSRKVIDHVGLAWNDACLRFNENERGVRTASQWQVRQPIYNSSVGRWRAYEKHLGPLKEGLGVTD